MPEGPVKERLARVGLQLHARQSRGDAVLALVSQRAAGSVWPRARHRLAADDVSVQPRGLFDDGADGDRRLLVQQDSLWWRGRDKANLIRRAAEALAKEKDAPWSSDQQLSVHQPLRRKPVRGPSLRVSHARDAAAGLLRHAVSGALCCGPRDARRRSPPATTSSPTWAPTKPGPICPAAPARAACQRLLQERHPPLARGRVQAAGGGESAEGSESRIADGSPERPAGVRPLTSRTPGLLCWTHESAPSAG